MNKLELNSALNFLTAPAGELQTIIYAQLQGVNEPRKLDVFGEDLKYITKLFVKSIEETIINEVEYTVLPLSTADERGKCFYEYDLELPDELKEIKNIIGNDQLLNFSFNNESLTSVDSLIIVIADNNNEIALFKKLSTVEVVGRGGFILWKKNERFERFTDQMLRISSKFHALKVGDKLIVIDLNTIEKSFGFHDVITKEATASLIAINNMQIVSNIDSLETLIENVSFARKLTKVAKSSPVIKNNIPNENIIAFAKAHPFTRNKLRYNEDGTQFKLDTRKSKDLFIKILNDDLLTSELTKLYYDSLAKDGLEYEDEPVNE